MSLPFPINLVSLYGLNQQHHCLSILLKFSLFQKYYHLQTNCLQSSILSLQCLDLNPRLFSSCLVATPLRIYWLLLAPSNSSLDWLPVQVHPLLGHFHARRWLAPQIYLPLLLIFPVQICSDYNACIASLSFRSCTGCTLSYIHECPDYDTVYITETTSSARARLHVRQQICIYYFLDLKMKQNWG